MTLREEIRETVVWIASHRNKGFTKELQDKALDLILTAIEKRLPKEDCPIILAIEKRLHCGQCTRSKRCKDQIRNQLLADIRKMVKE